MVTLPLCEKVLARIPCECRRASLCTGSPRGLLRKQPEWHFSPLSSLSPAGLSRLFAHCPRCTLHTKCGPCRTSRVNVRVSFALDISCQAQISLQPGWGRQQQHRDMGMTRDTCMMRRTQLLPKHDTQRARQAHLTTSFLGSPCSFHRPALTALLFACTVRRREAHLVRSVDVSGVMRETMYAQVLVLTHERASIEELMPYHSIRLGPMPVLEMMGRSRALDPTCPRDASVFHWWKERLRAQTTATDTCSPRESENVCFAV